MNDQFFCYLCNVPGEMNAQDLLKHYTANHPDARVNYRKSEDFWKLSHVCDICGDAFDTIMAADAHLIEEHDDQYTCTHCGDVFRKALEYAMHVYEHTRELKCELCDASFGGKANLQAHYTTHLKSMKPFLCDVPNCDRRYALLPQLMDHRKRHTRERNYQCELCCRMFITENDLKSHAHTVHIASTPRKQRQVPSVCDVCGKTLASVEKLKFHLRTHTGYKPFKCEYCEKAFTKKEMLVEHVRVHTGERPFPCEYCEKRFTQRTSLVIHMRGHTGERPYACHICEKAFAARAMLNTHFKTCRGVIHAPSRD